MKNHAIHQECANSSPLAAAIGMMYEKSIPTYRLFVLQSSMKGMDFIMILKGIDSQIMITRTTDFSKDSNTQFKKGEMTQNFLAVQRSAENAADQTRVSKSQESEQTGLKLDAEREGSGAGGSSGGGRDNENEEDGDESKPAPRGNSIIDIMI